MALSLRILAGVVVGLCSVGLSGCSGDDGSDVDEATGSGVVVAPWDSYCVATFKSDYAVKDFDEVVFTAKAGEKYLLARLGSSRGAAIYYLTATGPSEFDIDADASGALPFTTNCSAGTSKSYYAAFTDVAVYDSEALTNKICEIKAGTVLPRDTTKSAGSALAGDLQFGNKPTTYQIMLNAFSTGCQNAQNGYISVPATKVFGTTTWLIPITSLEGP